MESQWIETKFSELCDISRGASPRPIHEWITENGVPWVKISDASSAQSRFINHTAECIRTEGKLRSVSVFRGDLILSNSATPGIPMFMGIEACIHDGWLLLRNFRGLDKLFAYYLLLKERTALVEQGSGSVFTNLKTEILKKYKVRIPPINEQHAIAHILGTLDDKIELNRRMNETLEGIARAIFKSWFVDFDPVRAKAEGRDTGLPKHIADLFPSRLVDSELGKIPEGWEASNIGQHFLLTMGQSPPGNTYNQAADGLPFYQGRVDFGFRFPSRRVFCTKPTRLAEAGDTLVSVRAPVGDINMAGERCAVGRGVAAVRHRSGSRSFTYYCMYNQRHQFEQFEAEGTVFGAINKKDFELLPFVSPLPPILKTFDRNVSVIDNKIEVNEQQSSTLENLRDTLLPKLISGELRVTDAERIIGRCA